MAVQLASQLFRGIDDVVGNFYHRALRSLGIWTIVSPLVITYTLLKITGVTMMEETIFGDNPAYRAYVAKNQRVCAVVSQTKLTLTTKLIKL